MSSQSQPISDALRATTEGAEPSAAFTRGPIWECKIGTRAGVAVPGGADFPMRRAVETAFKAVTGEWPEFIFSGWSAKLDEPEMAVVEGRRVSEAHYREKRLQDAAPDLLTTLAEIAAKATLAADACDNEGRASGFRILAADARAAIAKALSPAPASPADAPTGAPEDQ